MAELSDEDREILKQELTKLGLRTVTLAKKKAPVDTGRLRASITAADTDGKLQDLGKEALPGDGVQNSDSDFTVVVGTNVDYAPFIEFGTSERKGQPFLRPAADQAVQELDIDT